MRTASASWPWKESTVFTRGFSKPKPCIVAGARSQGPSQLPGSTDQAKRPPAMSIEKEIRNLAQLLALGVLCEVATQTLHLPVVWSDDLGVTQVWHSS